MTTRCLHCGAPEMKQAKETLEYDFDGIPVVLKGVSVLRCPKCGEREVGIPAITRLQKLIANAIARKPARLTSVEIRFLRGALHLTGTELAARMGVTKSTVSRWESKTEPEDMGEQSERLLRLMVLAGKIVAALPKEVKAGPRRPIQRPRLEHDARGWHLEPAR